MNAKEKQTVYLPVRLATFLLNEKKDTIQNIESRHKVDIKIVPDPDLDASSYEIDNEGLSESDFKEQLKQKNKNQRNNKKTDSSADGKIIQDQEVALSNHGRFRQPDRRYDQRVSPVAPQHHRHVSTESCSRLKPRNPLSELRP